MPIKTSNSDKAFKENVKTEYEASKPLKQSLAIAYNMKKKQNKHNMASGGQITDNYESRCTSDCNSPCTIHEKAEYDPKEEPGSKSNEMAVREDDRDLNQHGEIEEGPEGKMAYGGSTEEHGDVGPVEEHNTDNYSDTEDGDGEDMVGRIMKQRQKMYSRGGQIANNTDQGWKKGERRDDMGSGQYDDLVIRNDDMEDADYTGANSGDMLSDGREDDDRRDIVSRVMKSRRKRSSMDGMSGYGRSDRPIKQSK